MLLHQYTNILEIIGYYTLADILYMLAKKVFLKTMSHRNTRLVSKDAVMCFDTTPVLSHLLQHIISYMAYLACGTAANTTFFTVC